MFFVTECTRVAVRPLQRTDNRLYHPVCGSIDWYQYAADPSVVRPFPGPWHVHPDPETVQPFAAQCRRVGIYLPYFKDESPRLVRRDNLTAGMVVICEGADVPVDDFIRRCLGVKIEESWSYDAYLRQDTACTGIRSVRVTTHDLEMELVYDSHFNEICRRTVNGVESIHPPAAPAVRFGL